MGGGTDKHTPGGAWALAAALLAVALSVPVSLSAMGDGSDVTMATHTEAFEAAYEAMGLEPGEDARVYGPSEFQGYLEWRGNRVLWDGRVEAWEPAISGDERGRYREMADTYGTDELSGPSWETYREFRGYVTRNSVEWVVWYPERETIFDEVGWLERVDVPGVAVWQVVG